MPGVVMPDSDALYVDTGTICKTLGMSINTVSMYCKTGVIPAVRIGKKYRVPKEWLDEYVNKAQNWKEEYRNGNMVGGDAA